jgi:hypothetical protein
MNRFLLHEVDENDCKLAKGCQKIISSAVSNYFYKLTINDSEFFIDSTSSKSTFIIEEIRNNDLVFGSEDRFYVFSLVTGQIKLAMRTFDPILEFRFTDDFFLLFTEKELFSSPQSLPSRGLWRKAKLND